MSQSKQVKFILGEWLPALEKRDVNALAKLMAKDYRYTPHPKSLDHPEVNREQALAQYAEHFSYATGSKITVHSVTDTPGKVVLHATVTLTIGGTQSSHESILIDHITEEDGALKVKQVEEFADSAARADYIQSFTAAKLAK